MGQSGSEPGSQQASGGCQCGAIRYRVAGPITDCNVCHCRMCQKASGGPFMVFFNVAAKAVTWTSGKRATFASSSLARRGFCQDCGTPLTYERDPARISLSHGSLDDPTIVAPDICLSRETALPWSETVATLPAERVTDFLSSIGSPAIVNHQHPDHET